MQFLLLLCGLPGAGKSTVAAEFVRQYRETGACAVELLSFDDQQLDQSDWDETTFRSARSASLLAVEELLSRRCTSGGGKVVVVDDIMYLKSMRREVYVLGRKRGVPVVVVSVVVSLPTALARNAQRDPARRVTDAAIVRIHARFEPPSDHTADRFRIIIDNNDGCEPISAQVRRAVVALPPLVARRAAELAALAASANANASIDNVSSSSSSSISSVHRLDLWLRSETGRVMQALALPPRLADQDRRRVASALSAAKQALLASERARGVGVGVGVGVSEGEARESLRRAAVEAAGEGSGALALALALAGLPADAATTAATTAATVTTTTTTAAAPAAAARLDT